MTLDSLGEWRRSHYSTQVTPELDGQEVTLFGWVEDIRDLGNLTFLTLRDREGIVQVTVFKKNAPANVVDRLATVGKQYAIGVRGKVKARKEAPRGVEVGPTEIKILGDVVYPLPLDPTGRVPADIDVRLDARVMDLRRSASRAIFKIRHEILRATRDFLIADGFTEIQTPRLIGSATEGGAALFSLDYFGQKAYLAQSPQLYKEQLTSVFEKVFEIGPFFRAEESRTRRHISEFTSLDIECAFMDQKGLLEILERLMHEMYQAIASRCSKELETLNVRLEVPALPFKRLTYDEVIEKLSREGVEVKWGEDMPTAAEKKLGELYPGYYFLTDWPSAIKPFYISPREDDPKYSDSFDMMYGALELASGGTRVHEYSVLLRRLKEQGLNPESFKDHLAVFRMGLAPHAGWAIGIDRLVMLVTGAENIRECIFYPRDRDRLRP
jgi:nondiscriminating aspartyl-tRNA synthetase